MPAKAAPESQVARYFEKARQLKERKTPSLGQLNPLLHPPDLTNPERIAALKNVVLDQTRSFQGPEPVRFESAIVTSTQPHTNPALRMVVRFEVDSLTEDQLDQLDRLGRTTYEGVAVKGIKNSDGSPVPTVSYPPTEKPSDDAKRNIILGWYIGQNTNTLDSLHTGLFVFKDIGMVNRENFVSKEQSDTKFIVEIREASLYQTDLAELIIQASAILGRKATLDHSQLLYNIYYNLTRLGLKSKGAGQAYGMEDILSRIRRGLILPLANLGLSQGISQAPESVLLAGVPGTGKTLAGEELLWQDTGLFTIPLDSQELLKELATEAARQTLMPRVSHVYQSTGIPVIIHLDDIENLTKGDKDTYSTLVNWMAGVRESGFYVVAATNHPEQIPSPLLQPQRFGVLIHCGLPDEESRLGILGVHVPMVTTRLGQPLFASEEERVAILADLAHRTPGFTARFLAEIGTVGKSYLLERVSNKKGVLVGLDEEDLAGERFQPEDFGRAFKDVSSIYDKKTIVEWDEEIRRYVERRRKDMGLQFQRDGKDSFFSSPAYQRMLAEEAVPENGTSP